MLYPPQQLGVVGALGALYWQQSGIVDSTDPAGPQHAGIDDVGADALTDDGTLKARPISTIKNTTQAPITIFLSIYHVLLFVKIKAFVSRLVIMYWSYKTPCL